MNKRVVALLIASLVLGIVFAGQAEAKAIVKYSPSIGTLDGNPYPMVPDVAVSSLTVDLAQQLCGTWPVKFKRQGHGFARTRYGLQYAASGDCLFAQQGGQLKLAVLVSVPGSLSSASPPGLVLRL